jgi:indole-3-glycerol phosphate synthase
MTEGLLDAIVAGARRAADERQRGADRDALERRIALRAPRGAAFEAALQAPGLRVIAECKRRSPSRRRAA